MAPAGRHLLGALFRALDQDRGQTVRLLRLDPDVVETAEARRRFQEGLRSSLGLRSEGVAALLGFAVPDTVVHTWVSGRSLEQALQARKDSGQPFGWPAVLPLLEALVDALEALPAAHGAVGLHSVELRVSGPPGPKGRAVGPNRPVLLDWGLAQGVAAPVRRAAAERSGAAAQARLPPEVGMMDGNRPPDPRSDVFGLAAVAWELRTLSPPTVRGVHVRPDGTALDGPMRAVAAGLRIDPELRPPTGRAWLQGLHKALHQADLDPGGGGGPGRTNEIGSAKPRGTRLVQAPLADETQAEDTRPAWVDAVPEPPTRPVLEPWAVRGAVFLWSMAVAFAFVTGLLAWVAPA